MALGGDDAADARASPPLGQQAAKPAGAFRLALRGDDEVGDHLALIVGEPPHAAVGLRETRCEQPFVLGVDHVEIKPRLAVGGEDQALVDEGDDRPVAGSENDGVDLLRRAVLEDNAARRLGSAISGFTVSLPCATRRGISSVMVGCA